MSQLDEEYEPPALTEYGAIESVTEFGDTNKDGWGKDTDLCVMPLKGSF
ncbi:lasso RiPP family leader peptide-containing protein [Halorientalis pallida]